MRLRSNDLRALHFGMVFAVSHLLSFLTGRKGSMPTLVDIENLRTKARFMNSFVLPYNILSLQSLDPLLLFITTSLLLHYLLFLAVLKKCKNVIFVKTHYFSLADDLGHLLVNCLNLMRDVIASGLRTQV